MNVKVGWELNGIGDLHFPVLLLPLEELPEVDVAEADVTVDDVPVKDVTVDDVSVVESLPGIVVRSREGLAKMSE